MRIQQVASPARDHVAEQLARDEAALLQAEAAGATSELRFWESPYFAVVLGAGGHVAHDVNAAACAEDGVPVLRRSSGGGTVLLGPGCLLFSLVLAIDQSPQLAQVRSSYCYILERIGRGIQSLGGDAHCAGMSDMAIAGRKFSGNAQQRKRRMFLHHGTLLHDFDLTIVSRYLRDPVRQPEYRAGRPHDAFLTNLAASRDDIERAIRDAWRPIGDFSPPDLTLIERLMAEKYTRDEWIFRR